MIDPGEEDGGGSGCGGRQREQCSRSGGADSYVASGIENEPCCGVENISSGNGESVGRGKSSSGNGESSVGE